MILLNAYDWQSIITFGCIFAVVVLGSLYISFIPSDDEDDKEEPWKIVDNDKPY